MKKFSVLFIIWIAILVVCTLSFGYVAYAEEISDEVSGTATDLEPLYSEWQMFFWYGAALISLAVGVPILKKLGKCTTFATADDLFTECIRAADETRALKTADKASIKKKAVKIAIAAGVSAEKAQAVYSENYSDNFSCVYELLNSAKNDLFAVSRGKDFEQNLCSAQNNLDNAVELLRSEKARQNLLDKYNKRV